MLNQKSTIGEVITELRKKKALFRREGNGPARLRSIEEEFGGDGMVPAPERALTVTSKGTPGAWK